MRMGGLDRADWPVFLLPFRRSVLLASENVHILPKKIFSSIIHEWKTIFSVTVTCRTIFLTTQRRISSVKKVANKTIKLGQSKLSSQCSGPSYWAARADTFRAAGVLSFSTSLYCFVMGYWCLKPNTHGFSNSFIFPSISLSNSNLVFLLS